MSVRLWLTDEAWAELAPLLATLKSRAGRPPALRDQLCIENAPHLHRRDDWACPSARGGRVKKNGGPTAQALGRSRGGWATKIHAGWRDEHPSVAIVLTAGPCHESPVFETVWAQGPPAPPLPHAMMGKGADSDRIREPLLAPDMGPVIPPKRNRTALIADDKDLDQLREKGERCFNPLNQFRRIAMRYDKLRRTFLAFIRLVAAWIIIK
jgi:transposase